MIEILKVQECLFTALKSNNRLHKILQHVFHAMESDRPAHALTYNDMLQCRLGSLSNVIAISALQLKEKPNTLQAEPLYESVQREAFIH